MATVLASEHLPQRPSIEQLRKQARDLQRAVRSGADWALSATGLSAVPDYRLSSAQLATARRYGFASWPRLRLHVDAIAARTWVASEPPQDEALGDRFLRLACLTYDGTDSSDRCVEAAQLLADNPELSSTNLATAAVAGDVAAVRAHLAHEAVLGPFGWSPLMYLAYSRVDVGLDATLAVARLLLDAGADPNDGRFFLGLPVPFTVITGIFGGGEGDQQPHLYAVPFARLVLAAGAEPNDAQTLYNRMFGSNDDFLEVLFEFGLGQGHGGPWRDLLPDLLRSPTYLLRRLLRWAVTHGQRARVTLLAQHGVDVLGAFSSGDRPVDLAMANGQREVVDQLVSLGASARALDPIEEFVAAALAGDAAAVDATPAAVIARARTERPGVIVWAAGQERAHAVELFVRAGFDVNALGRGDVPVEQPWQTALHTAVERGNAELIRRLLDLGADSSVHDARFDATARDWAQHLGHSELTELFDG